NTTLCTSLVPPVVYTPRVLTPRQRASCTLFPYTTLFRSDIGTVIAPDADVKLFVTASADARALRRFGEMKKRGEPVNFSDILAEDRKSTRLNSSHVKTSYAVFFLKKTTNPRRGASPSVTS